MNLENTFTTTSAVSHEIHESAGAPAWDAIRDAMPDERIEGSGDDAGDAHAAEAEPAPEPRGERQAVVIDEFDPTLSFRDAKERAVGLWERWYVAELLRHTGGNLSEAARVAHSDRSHLRKLVRKHLRSAITPP